MSPWLEKILTLFVVFLTNSRVKSETFLESLDRESVNFAANPIDVSLVTRLLVVVVDQLFAKPLQCARHSTVITIKLSKFPSLIKMNATSCNTTVEAILLFTVRTTYCVFVPL